MTNESSFIKFCVRVETFFRSIPCKLKKGNHKMKNLFSNSNPIKFSKFENPTDLIESNHSSIIELKEVPGDQEMLMTFMKTALVRSETERENLRIKLETEISMQKSISNRIVELETELAEVKHQLSGFEIEKMLNRLGSKDVGQAKMIKDLQSSLQLAELERRTFGSKLEFLQMYHDEESKSLFKRIHDLQEELFQARSNNVDFKLDRYQTGVEIVKISVVSGDKEVKEYWQKGTNEVSPNPVTGNPIPVEEWETFYDAVEVMTK